MTDGEQWSDELDEHETDASPQGLGYAPLDYQVLDGDDGEDFQNENENEAGEIDQDGASSQQPDVRRRGGRRGGGGRTEFSSVLERGIKKPALQGAERCGGIRCGLIENNSSSSSSRAAVTRHFELATASNL